MPDYYFTDLSPHDLEVLTRDLLQEEFGVRLEAFSPGPDGGIDLRYAKGAKNLVVQCKHYPHANWSSLRHALRSEADKVRRLNPTRYVVATSMGLTPGRKDEIKAIFAGIRLELGDIFGREDLNNLLGRHSHIEQRHHKLWLTSTAVLSRVVNARIFSEQLGEMDAARRKASRYVSNPSLPRALDALNEHHFVLITGVPGIGKSTLAEMVLVEHLARDFEPFRIWEGVEEARSVWRRDEPQLFYFDDFLGRTGLRHAVSRNEDERLVRFIGEVRRSKNTRLILTTREYILNQAREFMEGLSRGDLDVSRCVIDLGDYTPRIRAEILYNHLYFSDLPDAHLSELVKAKAYRSIVRHANYSPRILEAMTDSLKAREIESDEYPGAFVEALDNPRSLWEKAFKAHLSNEARDLLLVLATMPDRVLLPKVQPAFEAFHVLRGTTYGFPRDPYDWERAVKELDGNFVRTQLRHGRIIIQFHNPSVRDFLEAHLRENGTDASHLIGAATVAQQLRRLWEILSSAPGARPEPELLNALARKYWSLRHTASVSSTVVNYGSETTWRDETESLLVRGAVMYDMVNAGADRALLDDVYGVLSEAIRGAEVNRVELVPILERIIGEESGPHGPEHALFRTSMDAAFTFEDYLEMREWAALADFADEHDDWVTDDTKERLFEAFGAAAAEEEEVIRGESDHDAKVQWFDELESVANALGVDLGLSREELEEEVPEWDEDGGPGWTVRPPVETGAMSDAKLDAFFGSLTEPRD